MRRPSQPLPREPLRRAMVARVQADLPRLRLEKPQPCRYPEVTLLIYYFPKQCDDSAFEPFEFAIRQSWSVLGFLPTVIVTHSDAAVPAAFATLEGVTVQVEPALVPGDIHTMSRDCMIKLYRRFETSHVLIIQNDGWPLYDALRDFLKYDFVGAPNVTPGWRSLVADALGKTILNGGFSLRTRWLCRVVSWVCRLTPRTFAPSEDRVYARFRPFFRFPSAKVARRFSEDALDGLIPPTLEANPMGFHRDSTYEMMWGDKCPLTVVSVVRDHACYQRCVRENPHLKGSRFVCYDNTVENVPIPVRYNAFLDEMPADTGWIFFAHEDIEVKEDPRLLLKRRSTLFPCGLIGTRIVAGLVILPFGEISDSDRDGGRWHNNRPPLPYTWLLGSRAENFDCCGFFVHADTFRYWKLRFDPACAWDLYAEDLCFQFITKTGHSASILPLAAHHWSRGNPNTERFKQTLAHVNAKYSDVFLAGGTCVFSVGKPPSKWFRLFQFAVHHCFLRWLS